ncbi:MAG: SPOR domain-containing protein [Prevotella sp.]|nr:SPOR domain-containing protein [Prevotella sp.]
MELRRHIEILLLRNDCVIVPNLGGFMAHHLPSRFDESDQMFIPPLRMLGFNPKLTMSDSLLAQSYMDAYDLSYPEAVKRIEHEVSLLKEKMEKEGCYELTDLGTLKVNANGRYEFEPCQSGLLSPALYGLGAFEMPLLSLSTPLHHPASTAVTMPLHPVSINHSTPSLATAMSHIDTPTTSSEEKTISIKVSVLRNLAVTAVAAIALVLFTRPVAPGEEASTTSEASMLSLPTHSQVSESATSTQASIIPSLCDLAKQIEESKNIASTPTAGNYTIVLGCNLPLENAKYLMSEIQSKGVKGIVLFEYHSNNMVVYGNYANREKAVEQLREFSSNGLTGWIMEVKE